MDLSKLFELEEAGPHFDQMFNRKHPNESLEKRLKAEFVERKDKTSLQHEDDNKQSKGYMHVLRPNDELFEGCVMRSFPLYVHISGLIYIAYIKWNTKTGQNEDLPKALSHEYVAAHDLDTGERVVIERKLPHKRIWVKPFDDINKNYFTEVMQRKFVTIVIDAWFPHKKKDRHFFYKDGDKENWAPTNLTWLRKHEWDQLNPNKNPKARPLDELNELIGGEVQFPTWGETNNAD